MAFPVHPVRQPSILNGQPNGKLPDSILVNLGSPEKPNASPNSSSASSTKPTSATDPP